MLIYVGLVLLATGLASLLGYFWLGASIDSQGFVHEPFFLLPIGYGLIAVGTLLCIIGGIRIVAVRYR
jgi:hypothetical protein